MFKKIVLLISLICCFSLVVAQDDKEIIIENIVTGLLENTEDEQDYTDLLEDLYILYENPININTATLSDLEKIPFLSAIQIANLLHYKKEMGTIYSLYELQSINGFSVRLLNKLKYFIVFGEGNAPKVPLKNMLKYSQNEILLRGQQYLGERFGYKEFKQDDFTNENEFEKWENRKYLGSPMKILMRYNSHYKDKVRIGLVAEKDAGEEFFSGSQKQGFDHYAGFVQVNDIGILKTVIAGDYLVRFGQGLAVWGGYDLGKSVSFLNLNKRNQGLKKYTSTNENEYMQGLGVSIEPIKYLHLTTYYSHKKIDGNSYQKTTFDDDEMRFTSFLNSGYHRSKKELENRKNIGERILGANVNFKYKNLKIGTNIIHYKFSKLFEKGNSLSDLYDFNGDNGLNYSLYANYRYDRIYVFSELAFDKNKAKALLGGITVNAMEQLQFSMLYRDYAKDYQALYSAGFGEKTGTKNERGWYMGMEVLPFAKWKLSAYFDMYEFPWLRMGVNAPSRGNDYKIRLEYLHSEKFDCYLQFYQEQKELNTQKKVAIRFLEKEKHTKLRLQLNYQVTPEIWFRNRIESAFYSKESENYNGFLLYQDVIYKSSLYPMSLTARYALFDIEDYDTRIYAYENDVLYAFSSTAFQNKGFRFYLNAKWNISPHLTLWAKYSLTKYRNKNTISSGLDMLNSDKLQELKVQLRWKF